MTQYLAYPAHDTALEDLVAIDPQPSTVGLLFGRRSYAASGAVIDELPHVEFNWSAFTDGVEEYQDVLPQFGLTSATTAEVSVYIQDENYEWALFNGTAVKPLIGSDGSRTDYYPRNFTILVHSLRAQA